MSASIQPFYERSSEAAYPRGRILLVTYHFPPGQTAGAMRWQKLARYAAERGWGTDVICLDPGQLGLGDDASLEDLPDGIRVFGARIEPLLIEKFENAASRLMQALRPKRREPPAAVAPTSSSGADADKPEKTAAAKSTAGRVTSMAREEVFFSLTTPRTWARSYWSWLDFARNGGWARRAESIARRIADPAQHRVVVSCGPPHMAHVAGVHLSNAFDLPLVVDMRDPWSLGDRVPESHASPLFFWLARHYERRAFARASLIVMNTEPARDAMQGRYPRYADDIIAVPNAYDERPVPAVERSGRFVIAYAGTIYLDRTPLTLFKAAGRLVEELGLSPDDISIEFMGHIDTIEGESIDDIAGREGLDDFVRTHPPGGFADAERFLAGGSMLVSLPQDSHLAIPSKIFDYMRFEARLLVFAESGSATAVHLEGSGVDVVEPHDVEATLESLRSAWQQHAAGERPAPIALDRTYSRRAAADRMFAAIDEMLGEDPA